MLCSPVYRQDYGISPRIREGVTIEPSPSLPRAADPLLVLIINCFPGQSRSYPFGAAARLVGPVCEYHRVRRIKLLS